MRGRRLQNKHAAKQQSISHHDLVHGTGLARKQKYMRSLGILLLIAIFATATVIVVKSHVQTKRVDPATQDYTQILEEAVPNLAPTKKEALQANVDKILTIQGYAKSPDLLLIVFLNSIYGGDIVTAKNYLMQLKQVYDPAVGYNKVLRGTALTMNQLDGMIVFAEKQQEEFKRNAILIPSEAGQ